MSLVEALRELDRIGAGGVLKICTASGCRTIIVSRVDLAWDEDGRLVEVRVTGVAEDGSTQTYRRTLTWSPEGYLQSVSGWEEA